MKRYVLGDIHGGYKALLQVFERSGFDYKKDKLIMLGDVCDGWPDTKKCIDELLKIKNLIYIIGNHDEWFLQWATTPREPMWTTQGGNATFNSYIPQSHIEFLKDSYLWHEENGIIFVHGGIDPNKKMEKQDKDLCIWDRALFNAARHKHSQKPNYKYGGFEKIFIGHTTTLSHKSIIPINYCNVWNLDTGAGWSGKLTIMDINTYKYWQSDYVYILYPNVKGR